MKECCNINDAINLFHEGVFKYVHTKVRNKSDVEDIVQEIMLKMLKAHSENREVRNLKNWIYTISNNTIFDFYRKNKIYEEIEENNLHESQDSILLDISEYIIPMINLLDEKYSEVLLLSDIEKIPQKEIANKLNLGISATKSRVQRARKLLRGMFTDCCDMELDKHGVIISCHIKDSCEPLKNIDN